MKILLIQSPRKYWPFLSEGDNYVLPQWMPYIASAIREKGHYVRCLDCTASHIGWKSLEKIIKDEEPDVIGVNESHAMFMDEALKLVELIKNIDNSIVVVCGGGQFSNTSRYVLENSNINYVVKGEGEVTVVELLECISGENDPLSVNGIAYIKDGKYFETAPRKLIGNLDELPFPAYDLMPMERYGRSKYLFSPGGITIHHSRGCTKRCRFCVWWQQMAERKEESGCEKLYPRWRTMSVGRTVKEIEYLKKNYNRNCFIFVDGSWNIDPEWNKEFAEEIIKRGINIKWFAFMRIDCILRDEQSGVFEKLVESGLSHICVGAEHNSEIIMDNFGKKIHNSDSTKQCVDILRKKYPSLFIQATFIVGTRNESRKTLASLSNYVKELAIDYPAFHAFTPVPGTELYEESVHNGWIEIKDFSRYDWNTPVISTKYLSRNEMEWEFYMLYKKSVNLIWLLKGLFSSSRYKRNMYIWWVIVVSRTFFSALKERIRPSSYINRLVTPPWYDN